MGSKTFFNLSFEVLCKNGFSRISISKLLACKGIDSFCEIIRFGLERLKINFIKNLILLCKHLKFDSVVEYDLLIA